MARNEDDVGVRLCHARCHRADPDLRYKLDVNPGLWICILQVMDELGEIFNRVNIVVRRG